MLPLIENKDSDHVLILGQSEIKYSYLMRIDDSLPQQMTMPFFLLVAQQDQCWDELEFEVRLFLGVRVHFISGLGLEKQSSETTKIDISNFTKLLFFSLYTQKFKVQSLEFEFDLNLWRQVRDVQSSGIPKFGSSKFGLFGFIPTLGKTKLRRPGAGPPQVLSKHVRLFV